MMSEPALEFDELNLDPWAAIGRYCGDGQRLRTLSMSSLQSLIAGGISNCWITIPLMRPVLIIALCELAMRDFSYEEEGLPLGTVIASDEEALVALEYCLRNHNLNVCAS